MRSDHVALKIAALLTLAVLLLSGCGTIQIEVERTPTPDRGGTATVAALQSANKAMSTQIATLAATNDPGINISSDSETIRLRMLYSFTYWGTVWADAELLTGAPETNSQSPAGRDQVWVDSANHRFRMISGQAPERVDSFSICDGVQIYSMDTRTGRVQNDPLPVEAKTAYYPSRFPDGNPAPHPLAAVMPTRLATMLFPSELAQRGGTFRPVSSGKLAGRDVLEVEWYNPEGVNLDRFWIDTRTGVILRWQNYGKSGGEQPLQDYIITNIDYGVQFPLELFSLDVHEIPRFAQDLTGEPATADVVSTPDPAAQLQGEVYFYVLDETGQFWKIMRLPGACLVEGARCPEPELVAGQPRVEGQPQGIIWSPDGSRGLLIIGGPAPALFLFDPAQGEWTRLEEAGIDTAAWSPDSSKVIYAARKNGVIDAYLSHLNGAPAENLTRGRLGGAEINLPFLAWPVGQRVYITTTGPTDGSRLFLLNVPTLALDEIQQVPFKTGIPAVPSPDGRTWAATQVQDNRTTLLLGPAGRLGSETAGFTRSTIWPLAWAGDSSRLAFSAYSGQGTVFAADLYTVRSDGSELRQLYRSQNIYAFDWSPDHQRLIVEADEGSGFQRLFLVSLDGEDAKMIQAPGLPLDSSWVGPSWR